MTKKILLIICLLFIVGCTKEIKETTIYEYYITIDDIDIKVNRDFNLLEYSLGKYETSKYEDGNYIYSYDGIDIKTYNDNNIYKVSSFWLTSNKYRTNEGIRLGDSIDKMVYIYGDNYLYQDNVYTYELNNSSLVFLCSGGIIHGIEYNLVR